MWLFFHHLLPFLKHSLFLALHLMSSPHLDRHHILRFMLKHIFRALKMLKNVHFWTEPLKFSAQIVFIFFVTVNLWTAVGKPWGGCSEPLPYNVCVLYTRLRFCPAGVLPPCVTVEAAERSEGKIHANFAVWLLHVRSIMAHICVVMLKNNAYSDVPACGWTHSPLLKQERWARLLCAIKVDL